MLTQSRNELEKCDYRLCQNVAFVAKYVADVCQKKWPCTYTSSTARRGQPAPRPAALKDGLDLADPDVQLGEERLVRRGGSLVSRRTSAKHFANDWRARSQLYRSICCKMLRIPENEKIIHHSIHNFIRLRIRDHRPRARKLRRRE